MASLSAILQLVDLVTGESSYGSHANWGEVTDANLAFLEDALGEVTSKTLSSSDVTLSADEERSLLIKLSGTLSANVAVETNDRKGFWFVTNDTTGDFTVTFKTTSGTGIVVPQGGRAILVSDGTNVLRMMNVGAGGSASRPVYALKSGSYTALQSDDGAMHEYSATATVSFKPAALLGTGWTYVVRANGGIVTLDPNSTELVNGASTLAIADGTSAIVVCTGSAFRVIVILSSVASIPSASTTVSGISELSTDAEAIAKADTARAMTPSNLAALGSSVTFAGLVELATDAETQTGTDTARAITPANLTAKEASAANFRANTADRILTTDIVWSAGDLVTLTDAATIAVDMSTFISAIVTLGGNRALGNPSSVKPGQSGCIVLVQDGVGGRTLSYGSAWRFAGNIAPTLSTGVGANDVLFYFAINSSYIVANLVKGVF